MESEKEREMGERERKKERSETKETETVGQRERETKTDKRRERERERERERVLSTSVGFVSTLNYTHHVNDLSQGCPKRDVEGLRAVEGGPHLPFVADHEVTDQTVLVVTAPVHPCIAHTCQHTQRPASFQMSSWSTGNGLMQTSKTLSC